MISIITEHFWYLFNCFLLQSSKFMFTNKFVFVNKFGVREQILCSWTSFVFVNKFVFVNVRKLFRFANKLVFNLFANSIMFANSKRSKLVHRCWFDQVTRTYSSSTKSVRVWFEFDKVRFGSFAALFTRVPSIISS